MFWCFSTVLFLSVVLGFGSAGDSDECIRKFENAMSRGFDLDDCKDAVLGIKLPKSYGLKLAIKNDEQKSVDFNLTINEVCEVKLEGKKNTNGRWELKTGDRKIRCSYDWCHLEISREGKFTTKNGEEEIACSGKNLQNPIDNDYYWTKIRVNAEDLKTTKLLAYVDRLDPDLGEIISSYIN